MLAEDALVEYRRTGAPLRPVPGPAANNWYNATLKLTDRDPGMPDTQADAIQHLQTVRDWLRFAVSRFSVGEVYCGHGTDNLWDEAVQLVMQTLHLPMMDNTQYLDARLTNAERETLFERIEKRVSDRIPVPYLTGEAWFMGLPFEVDERVLIPRSPMGEFLLEEGGPWLNGRPVERILDLCSGSGCIGIAAACQFPRLGLILPIFRRVPVKLPSATSNGTACRTA